MKKLLILAFIALPLCGLVWSEDPSLTEEQREQRRELNKRIAEKRFAPERMKRREPIPAQHIEERDDNADRR